MAYQAAIPAASDAIATSQADIQNNFGAINSLVQVNHVGFNTADAGKHSQITFPVGPLVGQPFTYAANEIGLQSINNVLTGVPDIWMSRGVTAAFPITGKNGIASDGWSYLPSGLLIKWGTRTAVAAGNTTVTFPVAATNPLFASVYITLLTPTTNITAYASANTIIDVTVNTSAAGTFNFLTIGI